MNIFLDDLFDLNYFSDPNIYLNRWTHKVFEHLDEYIDNSLIINVTTLQEKTLQSLELNQYRYIFILDLVDPPHYNTHLQILSNLFSDHLDKTYYVSCAHKNPYFKTIYFNIFLALGPEKIVELDTNRQFIKKYVSFNRNPHYHRLLLLKTLYENNLLEEGYVSGYLYANNKSVFSLKNYPKSFIKDLDSDFLNLFPIVCKEDSLEINSEIYNDDIENDFYNIPKPYYLSPVSLLAETSTHNDSLFITEKSLKSLVCKQLIMPIGSPRTYEFLTKTYGLKNYGFDFEPRLTNYSSEDKIKYYCSFLKETTLDDLTAIYKQKEDILEYNKNKVLKEFKQISYNLFLTSLKKHHIIHS